jgi:nucleoid-associated protein YgaU
MSRRTLHFNANMAVVIPCVAFVGCIVCLVIGCGRQLNPPLPDGEYRVVDGDSLSSLAKRKYGDIDLWFVLLNANPDLRFRPNFTLKPGETIILPRDDQLDVSLPKSVFPKTLPADYVVLPGDSLHFIALRCYGDRNKWQIIYDANKDTLSQAVLADTRRLIAGQVLKIPKKPD